MSARPSKRVRLSSPDGTVEGLNPQADDPDAGATADEDSSNSEEEESGSSGGEESGSETGVTDEEEAIALANNTKHAPKPKKRRRALSPDSFGAKLHDLLSAPAPTAKQLAALHRPAKRAHDEEAIERKAMRLVHASKHAHEERGHVTDIIAGWTARPPIPFKEWPSLSPEELEPSGGAEAERQLRRLAQKGTVKLFNAIRAAQGAVPAVGGVSASNASTTSKHTKAILPKEETPDLLANANPSKPVAKGAPNLLGSRGKEEALAHLSRDSFLSILKGGGTNKSAVPSQT